MRSEDMLSDLVKLPQVLRRLAEQPRAWQPLAQALQALDSEDRVPTSKWLQQELSIPASRFRQWLEALYAAYLSLLELEAEAVPYGPVKHQLFLTGRRAAAVYSCYLPVTPRVGEQLQLDFLRAVTGGDTFYVDSLTHDFTGEQYVILVHLKPGYYNGYRQELLHRARFEETMSLHLELRASDYLLDSFLRERYPPPPESLAASAVTEKAQARYGSRSSLGRRRPGRTRSWGSCSKRAVLHVKPFIKKRSPKTHLKRVIPSN